MLPFRPIALAKFGWSPPSSERLAKERSDLPQGSRRAQFASGGSGIFRLQHDYVDQDPCGAPVSLLKGFESAVYVAPMLLGASSVHPALDVHPAVGFADGRDLEHEKVVLALIVEDAFAEPFAMKAGQIKQGVPSVEPFLVKRYYQTGDQVYKVKQSAAQGA